RSAGENPRTAPGATLPPDLEAPKDWESFIGDLIAAGKAGDLGAMAATPCRSLSIRSRLQAWSLVRWMIAKDQQAFAAMIRHLLHSDPAELPAKALLGALRPTFHHDLVSLIDEWKDATKKAHAAAK